MVPAKRDKLAHTKPGVCEQRDDRLIPPLEVVREDGGEAGIADPVDLFGGEPDRGLFPSLSACFPDFRAPVVWSVSEDGVIYKWESESRPVVLLSA